MQPLAELPALIVADVKRDVRGWELRDENGDVLGVVLDLLADPDRLIAEFLVVAPPGARDPVSIVPLSALSARAAHLVVGSGVEAIGLRYRSTVGLSIRTAAAGAGVLGALWLLTTSAC